MSSPAIPTLLRRMGPLAVALRAHRILPGSGPGSGPLSAPRLSRYNDRDEVGDVLTDGNCVAARGQETWAGGCLEISKARSRVPL